MVSLLKKDFWVNFTYLLMTLVFIPLAYVLNLSPGFIYYGMVLGIIFNMFYYDNQAGINQFIVSLPLARQTVVTARYLFYLLVACLAFGYQFLIDRLAHYGLPYLDYQPMDESALLTRLCGVLVLGAFSLPLYFKFSYMKAFIIQIISFVCIVGLFSLTGMLLNKMNFDVQWLIGAIQSVLDWFFRYPVSNIILVTFVISLLSFALSSRIYNKKDLLW